MKLINASLAILSTFVIAACSSVQATNQAPDGILPPPPPPPKSIYKSAPPPSVVAPSDTIKASVPTKAPIPPKANNKQVRFYDSEMELTIRNNDPERYMTVDGQTFSKAEVPQSIIDKVAEINAEARVVEAQARVVEQDVKKRMEVLKPLLEKMKVKTQALAKLKVKERMREIEPKLAAMKLAIQDAKVSEVDDIVEQHMRHIEPLLEAVHADIDNAELEEIQTKIEEKTAHFQEERMQTFDQDMQVFEDKLAVKEKELKLLIADFVNQRS